MQTITDAGCDLSKAEFGAFFYNLVDGDGEKYQVYTLSGAPLEAFEKFGLPSNTSLFGPTFRGECTIRIEDVYKDPRYGKNGPYYGMPPGHLPVRSYLAVPVISRSNEVLGGLFYGHSQAGVFTERAERLVEGLAKQAAIGIDNAQLYQRAQQEIEQRKRAEQSSALLAAIVQSSEDAIISKDLNAIITSWNRGAERIFGYAAEEAVGKPITILIPPERLNEEPVLLERIRAGERIEHYETVRRRKDGTLLDISLTISPLFDTQGQVIGASKIARDITGRKLAEAALVKSEKLVAAGRLAAILAHEINNPLQAVTNLMSLLGRSPRLDPHERVYAAMAEDELGRVVHLTQQSLSFYRESIHPTTVNVEEVLDNIVNLYATRLKKKEITLKKQYRSNGATINSFPGEIRQVFSTLLLNAMEAVDNGGAISIRVRKSLRLNHIAVQGIRISVVDNGVGIPPHNTASIFEPFFTTKGEHGTGLGLWVANGIVNRLGGSIRLRSSVRSGKSGTCFSIFLPTQLLNQI